MILDYTDFIAKLILAIGLTPLLSALIGVIIYTVLSLL